MFSMNDGSLSSLSTKGASSSSSRRRTSRGVSSSGRIAKSRFLEGGQTVAELDPADIVAQPRMMRGWKCPWRIEAAGGDVEEIRGVQMRVHQRRAAGSTEATADFRR